ncbi:MAG: hypothetical protein GY931_04010 [Maribacter sp.]|nr:hypothetical protein [Maribacter sp.]
MTSKIMWLRISYWTAAIADFIIAFSVLIPERVGLTKFVYPMGLISVVAISWGILLLIADRKPIDRRWILIPTIIVIVLLSCVRIYAAINGLIEFSIAYIILGVFIISLLTYSYINSKSLVGKS